MTFFRLLKLHQLCLASFFVRHDLYRKSTANDHYLVYVRAKDCAKFFSDAPTYSQSSLIAA